MDTRGDSIRVVHPLFPTEGGGSIPTSPLQFHIGKIERKVFAKLNHAWHSRLPNVGNCTIGICYGAEFQGIFYAVAWWSHPVNAQLTDGKTFELRRMAVCHDAPKNTPSRFLSVMVRMLRKERPELCKLLSYQDTEVHTGTIYRASGWTAKALSKGHSWTWGDKATNGRVRNPEQSIADKIRWELDL